jgi:protein-S-isoprenylcysteine O-methyltransferase Ste14
MVEDRFLHEGLAGYAGYAERVKYRLVPGLW